MTINFERLREFREIWINLPAERLDIDSINIRPAPCGTIACALGHAAIIYGTEGEDYDRLYDDGQFLLNINIAMRLFGFEEWGYRRTYDDEVEPVFCAADLFEVRTGSRLDVDPVKETDREVFLNRLDAFLAEYDI